MTAEILFNLLPREVKDHFTDGGTYEDFPDDMNNFFEFIDEGADRAVFALSNDFVVKFEYGHDQSLTEYETYKALEHKEVATKIYSNPWLVELGVIFAERVIPMEEYFLNILGDMIIDEEQDYYAMDFISDFSANENSLGSISEYLWDKIDSKTFEELSSFVGLVGITGLNDMHVANIGVSKDGRFMALDLGYGGACW